MTLNTCCLLGQVANPPDVSFTGNGAQSARTTLCVAEERDGKTYRTYVPLSAYGRAAQTLGDCESGGGKKASETTPASN